MIKKPFPFLFLSIFFALLLSDIAPAQVHKYSIDYNSIVSLTEKSVRDSFSYSGIAAFYNSISAYILSKEGIESLDEGIRTLVPGQSLAVVGHYKILVIDDPGMSVSFSNDKLLMHKIGAKNDDFDGSRVSVQLLLKSDLDQLPEPFYKLKYIHLWKPFRGLCLCIEAILLQINSIHSFGWGVSIILFSLLFKIFTFPVNIWITRAQRNVSHIQARLAPELEYIKANFSGEDAHHKFIAAHKQQGVTPFYKIKPLLLIFAMVPFWIAIFNALGEMDHIAGHAFLWIQDLAYPDAIYNLGIRIPLLGNSINLLPILMTILNIFAALLHQNRIISSKDLRKQKLNLYF